MTKKRMLVLTNRRLHNGPRMIREFDTFQHDFAITALGTTPPRATDITYINVNDFLPWSFKLLNAAARRLYYRKHTTAVAEFYPKLEQFIVHHAFDVIIIHEPVYLPLLWRLKKKLKFISVYNAHEYHPLEFEDKPGWTETIGRYQYALYERYLSGIDLLVNVCEGIAKQCESHFQKSSLVVPNVASQSNILPSNNTGPIRMIYHGAIMPSRNIEDMIDVATLLGENYQLDLMGVVSEADEAYGQQLKRYAQKTGNVSFIEPVAFDKIISTINAYDIGLFLLRPNNFNYTHALPNKLYEFIQAKLAIAIGPSIEMKRVVEQYQLGVVADDFSPENLANKIKSLSRNDIQQYKEKAVVAATLEHAAHYSALYLAQLKSML